VNRLAAFLALLALSAASQAEAADCKAGEVAVTLAPGTPAVIFHGELKAIKAFTGRAKAPAEGSLLPGTYCFQHNARRNDVLKRMSTAMTDMLAREWPARSSTAFVSDIEEAVILASLIESEKPAANEWLMMGAVYSNRLRNGMFLQSDATIIYPITKGRALQRRISQSEIAAENGYNTYTRLGLPIAPITTPSSEAIRAVLHPADSDALFFVSDGKGGHVFASTLDDHNANVERWYAIRVEQGDM
jgi:UPF0755 protein